MDMATVLCEKCGSQYKFEIAKDLGCCPVCKAPLMGGNDSDCEESLDESEESPSFGEDFNNSDLYFYSIDSEDKYEDKSWRRIYCQCTTCKETNSILYSKFSVVNSEYAKLKDVEISCKGCGKMVTNLIIPKRPDGWRELKQWEKDYEHLPKCPICSSTKIHKISMTNKAASIVAFGIFSAGHVSKTYKCDICGSKF